MIDRSRRAILVALAMGTTGLAGWLTVAANDDEPATNASVVNTDITTVGSVCGSPGDEYSSINIDGTVVDITGGLAAPTPCHEAVIEGYSIDAGTLTVTIDVEAVDSDSPCIQCVGLIEYEATVELDEAVEDATVEYAS